MSLIHALFQSGPVRDVQELEITDNYTGHTVAIEGTLAGNNTIIEVNSDELNDNRNYIVTVNADNDVSSAPFSKSFVKMLMPNAIYA